MKTRITDLLGIEHPIIQAGMSLVSYVPLVVAVSKAGGLGILTVTDQTPAELRKNIRIVRELIDNKPFGVNLLPYVPAYKDFCQVILEERVPVFSHGLGNPFKLLGIQKPPGMIFMPTVGNLKHAKAMEQEGADIVIVHGFEGGGHVGYLATTIIVPEVAESLKIPIVAAGGFCDGRGLAAALSLGAEGIAMGSRFCVTQECPVHDNAKVALLKAREEDAVVSLRYDGLRFRLIPGKKVRHYWGWWSRPWEVVPGILSVKNGFKVSWSELLKAAIELKRYRTPLVQFACGYNMVKKSISDGNTEIGVIPSGQVAGRLHDIPTCDELIRRIVVEAEEIIKSVYYRL